MIEFTKEQAKILLESEIYQTVNEYKMLMLQLCQTYPIMPTNIFISGLKGHSLLNEDTLSISKRVELKEEAFQFYSILKNPIANFPEELLDKLGIEYLYGFFYTDCVYENDGDLVSLHKTKEDAEEAMEDHKALSEKIYERMFKDEEEIKVFPFGEGEAWYVDKVIVE